MRQAQSGQILITKVKDIFETKVKDIFELGAKDRKDCTAENSKKSKDNCLNPAQ